MSSYDVAIIGAGVIGSSVAYHLAREGSRVVVFDDVDAPAEPSASWASAGGVRSQNRDPREWKLSIAAAARWPHLDKELARSTGFRRGGHLHVVEDEDDGTALQTRIEREREAGIQVEYVDRERMRKLAPGLSSSVVAAAYTPSDGQADPRATTYAFATSAVKAGATYARKLVERIAFDGGRVSGVIVGGTVQEAATTILAAGSWSMRLAAAIGLELPVKIRGYQMVLTMPNRPALEPTITATGRPLSLKQLRTGAFLIGGGWATEVDENSHTTRTIRENVEANWETATAVVPSVANALPATAWGGLEGDTIDGVPLIGPAPGVNGLYLALGFSGHGFQLSPAVGEAVANAVRSGTTPEALRELSPSRFLSTAS